MCYYVHIRTNMNNSSVHAWKGSDIMLQQKNETVNKTEVIEIAMNEAILPEREKLLALGYLRGLADAVRVCNAECNNEE